MLASEQIGYGARDLVLSHFSSVRNILNLIDLDAVQHIVELFREARQRQATIYIAGNGGSASTASHWVNDLGKATKRSGQIPMRVMSLSDNVSWLSALANDEGYERVFSGQLENFARAGDVLVCISASGNSPNLISAVEAATRRSVTTVGFLGFDGGALKSLVDKVILVESQKGAYELVEDAHSIICHAITRCLASENLESA